MFYFKLVARLKVMFIYDDLLSTYQVFMRFVIPVEDGDDFSELRQNIIVSRHVGCQDASDNTLTYFPAEDKVTN